VQPLAGKPLVAHTLIAARDAQRLDRILCTTDCPQVRQVAKTFGIEVLARPERLANDKACMRDVVAAVHEGLQAEAGVLPDDRPVWYATLYPTCPLRTARHIDACIEYAATVAPFDSIVSVCRIKSAPPSGFTLDDDGVVRFVDSADREYYQRQQKIPKYRLNGAIWVLNAERLDRLNRNMIGPRTAAFVMDEQSSVDIDTPVDLKFAEVIMETAYPQEVTAGV